ncbi:nuclear transport factor 2 family protein [Terrimonas pollutisoli]|uniref:nuclear transport factor 2 family protein n=1 Tax=Terrimonas pollutisoli TaxID=3034147 RepID=UPI0023EE0844|nr:nuclear transport factor 2 family protein [Terrimonas sp. H1YJ31]
MKKALTLMVAGLFTAGISFAQSKKIKQVAKDVNDLKEAMISADSAKLAAIVSDDLSYGHSGGKIEDKSAFIRAFVNGSSDFVTIDITEQKIRVYQNTAVVTHILNATTNDNGKPGTVKLSILTVWNKQNSHWKMVARQAVRPQ